MRRRDSAHHCGFGVRLGLIAVAGLVFRITYDIANRHRVIQKDGFRYHYGAIFLADGKGFVGPLTLALTNRRIPDTGHPPAWTIILAGATKLGLRTWLEHGFVASLVGTATIVMVGLAARAAFGRERTALIAAALAAFYPFVWLYEREVLSEPLAMLWIATAIWLAYKFLAAPRLALAIALGAVVGVMAMTESELVAVAVLLILPLVLFRRRVELRARMGWLVCAAAVCVAVMAPWSVYLSSRFDTTVLLTGAIGGTMSAGNCPQTYSGVKLGYYDQHCLFTVGATGNPFTDDARARKHAFAFMSAHKGRAVVVMAARVGRTFGAFRPFQQMHLETERGTSVGVFRVGFVVYWALLPFALAGVVVARRRHIAVYPLLIFPGLVVLTVVLSIGSVRYRAPAEIALVLLAAVGVDAAVSEWSRRVSVHRPRGRSTRATVVPEPQ